MWRLSTTTRTRGIVGKKMGADKHCSVSWLICVNALFFCQNPMLRVTTPLPQVVFYFKCFFTNGESSHSLNFLHYLRQSLLKWGKTLWFLEDGKTLIAFSTIVFWALICQGGRVKPKLATCNCFPIFFPLPISLTQTLCMVFQEISTRWGIANLRKKRWKIVVTYFLSA